MDFIKYIKEIKHAKGITNDELSSMSGISLGTLNKMLAGASNDPKLSNVISICRALGCSVGEACGEARAAFSEDEASLLTKYRALPTESRELVRIIVNKEAARHTVRNSMRELLLYDLPVSAGTGMFLEEAESVKIKIPDTASTKNADFALKIRGNSMENKFHDGDIILVKQTPEIEVGEFGIFALDGNGYFKKYGGDRLISLNPEYKDIKLSDYSDVECLGRVIGRANKS